MHKVDEHLVELLHRSVSRPRPHAGDRFLGRCRDAATAAGAVRLMAGSVRRIGFRALPFSRYVERLAYAAGISLQPVLRFFRISASGQTAALDRPAEGVVRLAVNLGVPARELCAHIRIAYLLQAGLPGLRIPRMRGGARGQEGPLATVEETLSALEGRQGQKCVARARRSERTTQQLYAKWGSPKSGGRQAELEP